MLLRLLLVCLLPLFARASAQQSETILVEGKPTPLLEAPLEGFWSAEHPKPSFLSALSTGCYRGYFGTWEIKNDRLLLLNLEQRSAYKPTTPVSIRAALGVKSDAPLLADWFSGVLPVAHGIDEGYLGLEDESPDIDYLYVANGQIIRRIKVHNYDKWPPKAVPSREVAWDGNASNDRVSSRTADWVKIGYIYSHYEEVVDRNRALKLRGVYFPGKIWFPPTQTPRGSFRIVTKNIQELPAVGSNIEITATVKSEEKSGPYFVVSKIEVLPASEPIRRLPAQQN